MNNSFSKKLFAGMLLAFVFSALSFVSTARAVEDADLVEAEAFMSVSATTMSDESGYGGDCTIPVTPPPQGFGISAAPIYRNWWEYWYSPKVALSISGGDAFGMKVSNFSDFRDGYKAGYATNLKFRVYRPDREGWKYVYAKFYSSCGAESPVVSTRYYYWGWN